MATRAQLQTYADDHFTTNAAGEIEGAELRQFSNDIATSSIIKGEAGDLGGALEWAAGLLNVKAAGITLAMMASLAQSTFVGRAEAAGTGVPQALSVAQAKAILDYEIADVASLQAALDAKAVLTANTFSPIQHIIGTADGDFLHLRQGTTGADWYFRIIGSSLVLNNEIGGGGTDAFVLSNTGALSNITSLTVEDSTALVTIDRSEGSWVLAPQTDSVLHLKGAIGLPVRLFMDARGSNIAHAPNIAYRWARENAGNPSAALSGDILGLFSFFGYGATGYSSQARAQIRGLAAETWTDSAQGTRIAFLTTALGAATAAERFAIEPDGTLTGSAGLDLAGNLEISKSAALVAMFEGDNAVDMVLARYQTGASPAGFNFYKGRGTRAAPEQVLAGDDISEITSRAYDNTAGTPVIRIAARQIVEAVSNITSTSAEGRHIWLACPAGSLTLTELMRADHATGLTVAAPVIAESFSGEGTALTALNASELGSGTVPNGRISGSYTGLASLSFTSGVLGSSASQIVLRQSTSDGSDTGETYVTGGGLAGATRGGTIHFYGNEHATQAGMIRLIPGSVGFVSIEGSNGADIAGTLTVPTIVLDDIGIIVPTTDHLDINLLTADGADNHFLRLGGGGVVGSSRGATLQLFGNEHASQPGNAFIQVTTGSTIFLSGNVNVSGSMVIGTALAVAEGGTGSTTATAARAALIAAGYDTTTVASTVTFPIGHYVLPGNNTTDPDRNAASAVRLSAVDSKYYATDGAGTLLTGTWRSRGKHGTAFVLLQRVA